MVHPNMVYLGEFEAASDGTMATALRTEGSESQQAVDARIEPVAVAAIAEKPQVLEAAAVRAGTIAATDLQLVRGDGVLSPGGTSARISWTYQQKEAAVPATVTSTIELTSVTPFPVEAHFPVLDPTTGTLPPSVLPAGLAADDAGVRAILGVPASESARLLVSQFGGRLVFTDPLVGGVGDGVTDNTAAFNRGMALIGATGGEVFFPPGVYRIDGTTVPVPGGVTLRGTGIPYADPTSPIVRCSVIRAGAPMTRLIELGANPASSAATDTSASLLDIFIDGRDLADYAVVTEGRRWVIDHSLIYWGRLAGLLVEGQNGAFQGWSVVSQNSAGSCVIVRNEPDNKFFSGQLRQPGTDGACLLIEPTGPSTQGQGDVLVQNLHMWTGQNGIPTVGALIRLRATSSRSVGGIHILNNELEGCLGDQVQLIAENSGAVIRNVLIEANNVFQNSLISDGSKSFLSMSGPGTIADINVNGNMLYAPSTTKRWKSVMHDYGTGPRQRMLFGNNTVRRAIAPWTMDAGSTWSGPEPGINTGLGADGNEWRTRVADRTTLTGADGSRTVFAIASGLPFQTARAINVTAMSSAASRPHFVDLTGGTLSITFDAAPAAGADLRVAYDLWQ